MGSVSVGRAFVDSNVFVYADDASDPVKQTRAIEVIAELIASSALVVSTQVLQEYFVSAVKKLKMSAEAARHKVEILMESEVVLLRPELILGAIDLHRLRSISLWDALIVKAASAARCERLLSEDLQHGQVIDGVRVENPFLVPVSGAREPRRVWGSTPGARQPRAQRPRRSSSIRR